MPGYEASGFAGIGVPRNTPADIITLLEQGAQCRRRRAEGPGADRELGGTPLGSSPAEFGAIISEATEKWAKVIKFAGIKVG